MFNVTIDRAQARVIVAVSEFPTVEIIRRKEAEIIAGIAEIMRTSPQFDLLVSVDGLGPLTREAGEHLDAMLARIIAKGLRRSAHVGFGAIAKMQLQRLTGNDDRFQFFVSTSEAQAWLDG